MPARRRRAGIGEPDPLASAGGDRRGLEGHDDDPLRLDRALHLRDGAKDGTGRMRSPEGDDMGEVDGRQAGELNVGDGGARSDADVGHGGDGILGRLQV